MTTSLSATSSQSLRNATPQEAATTVLRQHWDGKLPVDPAKLATRLGLTVYARGGDKDPTYQASGGYHRYEGKPALCFNIAEHVDRQRFILAHALAHHVFDDAVHPPEVGAIWNSKEPHEVRATAFARELLMPRKPVLDAYQSGKVPNIERLAAAFGVTKDAMGHRLLALGVASGVLA